MPFRLLMLALISTAVGCGSSEFSYEKGTVQGMVTINGEPLASGKIRFIPEVGTVGKLTVAEIKDGHYQFDLNKAPAVGNHKIEIIAIRNTGNKIQIPDAPAGTTMEETEQYIPAPYNTSSRLKLEIKAGENEGNFDLKMRP
ncbi:hypothetical protein [uncultured Gimesia sp.]|jgi:hypothetical protein|uniref:hypothetical protein n=1 Tax=uncultured Gimesia sp. TaxID=1678688 RepID=UPI002632DC4A|nr:hypothetical protein [uncultured Gimesia sp.]